MFNFTCGRNNGKKESGKASVAEFQSFYLFPCQTKAYKQAFLSTEALG